LSHILLTFWGSIQGLTNAVFANTSAVIVELKTVYGFGVDLFTLAADAIQGNHVHIDIRNYMQKDGHRAIDEPLINRIVKGIEGALCVRSSFTGKIAIIEDIYKICRRREKDEVESLLNLTRISDKCIKSIKAGVPVDIITGPIDVGQYRMGEKQRETSGQYNPQPIANLNNHYFNLGSLEGPNGTELPLACASMSTVRYRESLNAAHDPGFCLGCPNSDSTAKL